MREEVLLARLHRALVAVPPPANLWYAVQVPNGDSGEFIEAHRLLDAAVLREPGAVRDWLMEFGRVLVGEGR